jgi:hypothetical protein
LYEEIELLEASVVFGIGVEMKVHLKRNLKKSSFVAFIEFDFYLLSRSCKDTHTPDVEN